MRRLGRLLIGLALATAPVAAGSALAQGAAPPEVAVPPTLAPAIPSTIPQPAAGPEVEEPADDMQAIEVGPETLPALPEVPIPELPSADPATGTGPAAPAADPRSLAVMRLDLAVLGRALQSLRAELVASGPSGFTAAGGTAAIGRMDQMEADIARLTGQVEEMRNRVEASIAEASNRAGDIEFRLCELDPGCDLGALTTAQLDAAAVGGPADIAITPEAAAGTPPEAAPPGADPVENAAFDRAVAARAAQDQAGAAAQFAEFVAAHPASPLVPEAMFLRGEALAAVGDRAGAGRAWLDAFTAAPTGARAPQALLNLADAMAASARTDDACGFYAEVASRFPATPPALEAETRATALRCPDPAVAGPSVEGAMDPEEAADLADGG